MAANFHLEFGDEELQDILDADEEICEHDREVDVAEHQAHLRRFIESKRNKETLRKTKKDIEKMQIWLGRKGENRKIEEIPPRTLDVHIGEYIMSLRKANGEEYEPSSLTAVFGSIKRHLEDRLYSENLMTSHAFDTSRKVLQAKRKELKSKGLGNGPNKAEVITDEDEELLWTTGALGIHNPRALRSTVWYQLTQYFGFRGRQETRSLKVGDLKFKEDAQKRKYVEFTERVTKTRQGDSGHMRPFAPKMWCQEDNVDRCPVFVLKEYLSRRPEDMKGDDSPLFLSINHKRNQDSNIWYSRLPMGVNELSRIMPEMAKVAGLRGKKTNHSVRKRTCTKLLHEGIAPTVVAQLSGHRNVASLNNYSVASLAQQRQMFDILSKPKKEEKPATVSHAEHTETSVCVRSKEVQVKESVSKTATTTVLTETDLKSVVRYSQETLPPMQEYSEWDDSFDMEEVMLPLKYDDAKPENDPSMMTQTMFSKEVNSMQKCVSNLDGLIKLSNIQGNVTFNITMQK